MKHEMAQRGPGGYWLTIVVVMIQACGWSAVAGAQTGRQIAVGVYFSEEKGYCPDTEQSFTHLQEQSGRLAKLYMNFQSWSESWNQFATRLANNSVKHGGVFMVVWLPGQGEDSPGHSNRHWSCKAITAGEHDAYIKKYAADVKAFGQPVLICLAHEMNGTWYPTSTAFDSAGVRHNGNTPADFVAMWRHVRGLFHDAGADNAYWVWAPNILFLNKNNSLAQQQADYRALYPGDDCVDWIGLDGYCDGVKGKWSSFADLFDASYKTITAITAKPLMIAEFGCSEAGAPAGTSKAAWIKQAYADIPRRFPRIELVNWFSRDKTKYGETDWRFNSSQAARAAYAAAVNSPTYQGEIRLKH